MTTRGLVLGAGGVLGAAWTIGALAAVREHLGWEPGTADVLVGTSAGSVLASALACGFGVDDRYVSAIETIRAACKRHGTAMGTGAYSLEHARACLDAGDQLILALVDDQALRAGAEATIAALR